MKPSFHMIAAITPDNGIGFNGRLLYKDPLDTAWFYNITLSHTVIMGRKTYQSIGHGGLPDRNNIVLSRSMRDVPGPCVTIVNSAHELIQLFEYDHFDPTEAYVIGGGRIYDLLMPYAKYLHLTTFLRGFDETVKPDTFFPTIDMNQWKLTSSVAITSPDTMDLNQSNTPYLRFETFKRKE